MANIEMMILLVLAFAVISYVVTKLNAFIGAVVTIVASTLVFSTLAYYGLSMNMDPTTTILPFLVFRESYLGTYFVVVIALIYMMVSFFHPYYVDQYKYKAAYHFLFLLSLAAVLGAFYSASLVQLFFFFELIVWSTLFLIPMGKSKEAAVFLQHPMYSKRSAYPSLITLLESLER